jgi:hypothetical protein
MGRIYVVRYIRMKFFAFSLKEMQDFVKKETIRGVIYGGIFL